MVRLYVKENLWVLDSGGDIEHFSLPFLLMASYGGQHYHGKHATIIQRIYRSIFQRTAVLVLDLCLAPSRASRVTI